MASHREIGSSYDVFLSFRGEDTRHSFTDHLYHALIQGGILAFRDSNDAERGEELKLEIEKAIKASDASIIVISENYATSTWCLDELFLILDQRKHCKHFVLPVFYHVEPSDVGKQRGTFTIEPDSSSPRWTVDNVNRWKAALTEVVSVIGLSLAEGPETEFLQKILSTIYNRLDRKQISVPQNLTGMDARDTYINSWLKQSEEHYLVIYGMAGSGKSTLAQYIVYSNLQNFESISIVEHIGSKCKEPQDIRKLQQQLCNDLSKGKDRRIPSVCQGTPQIEVLLEKKKSLIVLDDIVKESQLEDLLGSAIINKESKIIITTDNDISNWFKIKSKGCQEYEMKLLNDDESLELLSLHAFRSKVPLDGFEQLAKLVVQYCAGNPLALEVMGSSLSQDNSIRSWESTLNLFGKDIHSEIFDVLKRSYETLPYESVKELFLHIACFFVGEDMDYVVKILEPDYSAESKIKTLIKKCFLYVTPSNKLGMHRLLQDMAKSLVDRESHIPAKRSRIWRDEDSYNMLRRGKSSEAMKGLTLEMDLLILENEFRSLRLEEQLSTKSLQQMHQLKLLKLNFVELTGSFEDSSKHLRWLCWYGFNKSTIYSDIYMGNMVALDMSYSRLKEFVPPAVLKSLKYLNFKDSHDLLEILNINQMPNLESLILWNCRSLVRVCRTIENLERLALFNLRGCEKLFKGQICTSAGISLIASTSGVASTKQTFFPLPPSLQRLFLNNCYLKCTDYFPLSFVNQPSLQYLNLSSGLFEFLPSYNRLRELRVLDLSFCLRLKSLLCVPCTLAELYIYYCKSIEKITFESGRYTLQEFGYKGCINLTEIQSLIKLVPIANLDEIDLGHMMWLKEYENRDVSLTGDDDLTQDRSCRLQMLYEFNVMSTSLPDINHPKLTSEYSSRSTFFTFVVPMCENNRRHKGLNVTFKYTISGEDCAWFCKISVTSCSDLMYNPKVFGKPASGEVGIWLSYWPIGNTLHIGDEVKVFVAVMSGLEVLECGASLVYTDDDVANESIENSMGWVESLDLSGFQLISGAYYLCRRDFYQLMEVGRLTSGWFNILVGDHIDPTDIRGWRMTGRPRQSYQSYTELKTISCIIHNPETDDMNYNITEMLKSSSEGFTSTVQEETLKYGSSLDCSDTPRETKEIMYFKEFDHLKIQLQDIVKATDNFSDNKLIGRGRFGQVYKGELSLLNGPTMLAFKRFDRKLGQGNTEFYKEIKILSKYKHENLVSLMHFCIEADEMILVYEYVSRGSLDRYVSDSALTWIQRLKICVGVARAINFLHDPMETHQRVIHRDIKSSNILLDDKWTAKVSDLGLSKVVLANQMQTFFSINAVGTLGYCDPFYNESGILSKESDVYSFGVVLFEVMCGRLCFEFHNDRLEILVRNWIKCYEEKLLDKIIFPDLKEQMELESLNTFSHIAYRCVNIFPEERPTMAVVVKELELALEQQNEKMEVDRHSLKLTLDNELIKVAHILSMEAHKHGQRYFTTYNQKHGVGSSSSSMQVSIFAFPGSWEVKDWYHDDCFGETNIDETLFPSLRRIGENRLAKVNKAFLQRFQDVLNKSDFKSEVEKVMKEDKKILFTGHSSGGASASLATLWMLDEYARKRKTKIPIGCVTFGSPLIGDRTLTHAVRREKWSCHFTHFVMEHDIIPRIMLTPKTSIQEHLPNILKSFQQKVNLATPYKSKIPPKKTPEVKPSEAVAFFENVLINASTVASHDAFDLMEPTSSLKDKLSADIVKVSPYRPFGDYIFFTRDETEGPRQQLVVENPNAVLQLLFYFFQLPNEDQVFSSKKINEDQVLAEFAANSLTESLGYKEEFDKNGWDNKFHLKELNKHLLTSDGNTGEAVRKSNKALFDLTARAKLCLLAAEESEERKTENENQIKRSMKKYKSNKPEQKIIEDILEEIRKYKIKCNDGKTDYYEAFKRQEKEDDFMANVNRFELANIWDLIIEMVMRKDLPDEFEVWGELVDLATEFRHLVEPMDIANYYRHSKGGGYMGVRPKRYKFSQRWHEHANVMKFEPDSESNFIAEVEDLIKELDEPKNKKLEKVKEEFETLKTKVQKWKVDVTTTDVFWGETILFVLQEKLSRMSG